jgi:hypothetical protein
VQKPGEVNYAGLGRLCLGTARMRYGREKHSGLIKAHTLEVVVDGERSFSVRVTGSYDHQHLTPVLVQLFCAATLITVMLLGYDSRMQEWEVAIIVH